MFKQYEVKFKYADSYSHWEWRNQQCSVYAKDKYEARSKCIELYGLGTDCNYEILSVTEIFKNALAAQLVERPTSRYGVIGSTFGRLSSLPVE